MLLPVSAFLFDLVRTEVIILNRLDAICLSGFIFIFMVFFVFGRVEWIGFRLKCRLVKLANLRFDAIDATDASEVRVCGKNT